SLFLLGIGGLDFKFDDVRTVCPGDDVSFPIHPRVGFLLVVLLDNHLALTDGFSLDLSQHLVPFVLVQISVEVNNALLFSSPQLHSDHSTPSISGGVSTATGTFIPRMPGLSGGIFSAIFCAHMRQAATIPRR